SRKPPIKSGHEATYGTTHLRETSLIRVIVDIIQHPGGFCMRKALLLLLLFAIGVSMIVNGCGTLLQALQ
ncbi:MAG: hypothetical protein ACPLRM_07790, partial [Anaerolineae bacterium]